MKFNKSSKNKTKVSYISNSGDGFTFEHKVQAIFVALLLSEGCLGFEPKKCIVRVSFQDRGEGGKIDDLVVVLRDNKTQEESKLFIQIKRSIAYTKSNKEFADVLEGAAELFKSGSFKVGRDKIMLATGPSASKDIESFPWMCEMARSRNDEALKEEFAKPENNTQKNTIALVRKILNGARHGEGLTEIEQYSLLRYFYVINPDMWYPGGITESLILSLMPEKYDSIPLAIFEFLKGKIEYWNRMHCSITKSDVHNALQSVFREKKIERSTESVETIPVEANRATKADSAVSDTISHCTVEKNKLALMALVGSWINNEEDNHLLMRLLDCNASELTDVVHNICSGEKHIGSVINGRVEIKEKVCVFEQSCGSLLEQDIQRFKDIAIEVLSCKDNRLNKSPEDRIYSTLGESNLLGSEAIRLGLAQGIAILSSRAEKCIALSVDSRLRIGENLVSALFKDSDWKLWATLDHKLEYIAEADAVAFILQAKKLLVGKDALFKTLANQEHSFGLMGASYITGLVRALAVAAWDGRVLNTVAPLMMEFARLDPGGRWSPRPIDFFKTTFLPIAPQTTGSVDQRIAAITSLAKKCPKIAGEVLPALLPRSMTTYVLNEFKPKFVKTKDSEVLAGTWGDVWKQYRAYQKLSVDLALKRHMKIGDVISYAREWSPDGIEYLKRMLRKIPATYSSIECEEIWSRLRRCKEYAKEDAKNNYLPMLEYLETKFHPTDLVVSHKHLFSWDYVSDAEEKDRMDAVQKVFDGKGLSGVIELGEIATNSNIVGANLAKICKKFDREVLGASVKNANLLWFSKGYFWQRYQDDSFDWIGRLPSDLVTRENLCSILLALPFKNEVWKKIETEWSECSVLYWKKVDAYADLPEADALYAAEKFLQVGRPMACLKVLKRWRDDKGFYSGDLIARALLRLVTENVDDKYGDDPFYVKEAIRFVQNAEDVSNDTKIRIEWVYADLFQSMSKDALRARTIEKLIATSVDDFIQLLTLAYIEEGVEKKHLSDNELAAAKKAYWILHYWSVVPGVKEDGCFDAKFFNSWIKSATKRAKEVKRLKPFQMAIGRCLLHAPKDPSGFWMHKQIAKFLNLEKSSLARSSLRTAYFNSRGVHFVDESGKEDAALADHYNNMALKADEQGYNNIASLFRELATQITEDFQRMKNM